MILVHIFQILHVSLHKIFNMRCLLLIMVFVFVSLQANAQEVSENKAKEYASMFMSKLAGKSVQMQKYAAAEQKGYERFFVFVSPDNTSFTVVSKNKEAYPVIAYSAEGGFVEPMPESIESYFNWIDEQLHYVDTTPPLHIQSVEDAWESFSKNGNLPAYSKNVSPLLTTTWNQGCYYNTLCPAEASGPCGYCYAGCVATAMGQVINYHKYPETGEGSHMYGTGLYPSLSADFGATTYHWDSMPNSISSENFHVAQLLYHLGVSVDMGYSPTGSGASTITSRNSFVTYFRYSDYCFRAEKNNFPENDWIYLIENELQSRRPLLYRGTGSGGHAFVLDGMQMSNHFHFNWGWGGAYDGYFYVTNLRPGGADFTQDQAAIFALEPAETDLEYCNEYNTLVALSDTIRDGSGEYRYGNNTGCKWTIQPPGAGLIYINFLELAVEKDVDLISIYQGTSTSDPLIAEISGFDLPNEILVWGSSAYITFYSDAMMRADGFSFVYTSSQVGIEEAWEHGLINVYPNPTETDFTLEIDERALSLINSIELINPLGQTIMTRIDLSQHNYFDVSAYPAGMYFLRLLGNNEVIVKALEIY